QSSVANSNASTASTAIPTFQEAAEKAVSLLEDRWANHNRTVLSSFAFGVLLAADGTIRALRSPVTRKHLLNVFTTLAITIVIVYILGQVATLPVRILRRVVWGVTWAATLDSSHHNSEFLQYFDLVVGYVWKGFFGIMLAMPELGLYVVRYYFPGPMDRIFHESLTLFMGEIENPNFRLTKNATQVINESFDPKNEKKVWYGNLQAFFSRYWSRIKILLLVWALSFIPILGRLAWPSATFFYIGAKVNYPFAGLIFVLSFVHPTLGKYVRGPLMRAVLELRALARELVEPYLSRSKMTREQKQNWLTKHDAVIVGFALPLFLLHWIPLVGPALYFALATSASARLCLELFDAMDFQEMDGQASRRGVFEPRLGFVKKDVAEKVLVIAASSDVLLEAGRDIGFRYSDMALKRVLPFLSSLMQQNQKGKTEQKAKTE
ncbi:hypothetical protein HDU99_006719, partial [Rhizoclosmatium hyalinum]